MNVDYERARIFLRSAGTALRGQNELIKNIFVFFPRSLQFPHANIRLFYSRRFAVSVCYLVNEIRGRKVT